MDPLVCLILVVLTSGRFAQSRASIILSISPSSFEAVRVLADMGYERCLEVAFEVLSNSDKG